VSALSRGAQVKKHTIGGQAVLEGVMLRSPDRQALAVRSPKGEIITEVTDIYPLARRWPILGLPLLRGGVAIYEAMSGAISCLGRSAQLVEPDEEISSLHMAVLTGIALLLGIGLFFLLPAIVVNPLTRWLGVGTLQLNLVEGLIRVMFFTGYLVLISLSKDIKRTFEYHGAEHKVITCWEQERPLTPSEAAACSRLHPRCGTSFLLLVVVVSIVLFSLFSPANLLHKLVLRLALLPVLAGVAYELTRWTSKSNSVFARMLLAPGLMFQKLTTREPDLDQLEVALAALEGIVDPNDE
jgi:uncharacterized protein YqhQ